MQGIASARAEEIKRALDQHRAAGGSAYLLTLTLPHDAGERLKPMRRHVARAWQFVQSGAPWKRMKERIGFVGSIRALEVTVGDHGWHPHLHVLLFTTSLLTPEQRDDFVEFVYRRWRNAITRTNPDNGHNYRAPDAQHGVSLTESHRDDYVAKLGLADELARLPTKSGRLNGHRTPMQLLSDISDADASDKNDLALWNEYASEMHGARQLTWSKGLRSRFAIHEATDHELSDESEAAGEDTLGATIDAADWDRIIAHDVTLQLRILDAASRATSEYEILDVVTRLLDEARGFDSVPF